MKVTEEGLALIKRFEGFRAKSYRCPAGVWTVGYGHTSMAGPPAVAGGLELSEEQASAILQRDVAAFARDVAANLRVALNDQQFSALVSFAYNAGIGNFRKSSVLAAVNGGDMAAVPRRLQLWCKAGGRVLPGLVKRRAAEGEMFVAGNSPDTGHIDGPVPAPAEGKPVHKSTTILAALVSAFAGLASLVSGRTASIVLVLIIVAATLWIVRERRRKSQEEGV
jgi:lysozyme